ncbi:MAG TPA: metalloregulator ArsR/SmtB family transcription factor [Trueperaceae bacterium]|nr:metalloregulator ArsR/SmtB family transcription factor [Trueperaceae bacterium]
MSEQAARTFAALGDSTRLALVRRLSRGARLNVTELTTGTGVTRQAVSKHLAVLQGAGLVSRASEGRETVYRLCAEPLDVAGDFLERLARGWDDAVERLRAHVEQEDG